MAPFLCNNFLLEITNSIYKYPSIKPHIIIVRVTKAILFALLSLQELFKSYKSPRLKRKNSSRNLWRVYLPSYFNALQFLQLAIGSVVSLQVRCKLILGPLAIEWLGTYTDAVSRHCPWPLRSARAPAVRQEHAASIALFVAVAPPFLTQK